MTPSRALDKTTQNQYFHLLCKHPDLLAELDQLRSKGQTMKSKKMMLAASLLALSLGVSNADEKSATKFTAQQMSVVVKRHYSTTARSHAYKQVVEVIKSELSTRKITEKQLKHLRTSVIEIAKAERHAKNALMSLIDVRGGDPRQYGRPHKLVTKLIEANKMRLNRALTWNILERYHNVLVNGKILNNLDVPVESLSPTPSHKYITVLRMSKVLNFEKDLKKATCDLIVVRFLNNEGRCVSSFTMQPRQLPADVKLVQGAEFVEVVGGNVSKTVYDSGPRLKPIFKQRIHIAPLK